MSRGFEGSASEAGYEWIVRDLEEEEGLTRKLPPAPQIRPAIFRALEIPSSIKPELDSRLFKTMDERYQDDSRVVKKATNVNGYSLSTCKYHPDAAKGGERLIFPRSHIEDSYFADLYKGTVYLPSLALRMPKDISSKKSWLGDFDDKVRVWEEHRGSSCDQYWSEKGMNAFGYALGLTGFLLHELKKLSPTTEELEEEGPLTQSELEAKSTDHFIALKEKLDSNEYAARAVENGRKTPSFYTPEMLYEVIADKNWLAEPAVDELPYLLGIEGQLYRAILGASDFRVRMELFLLWWTVVSRFVRRTKGFWNMLYVIESGLGFDPVMFCASMSGTERLVMMVHENTKRVCASSVATLEFAKQRRSIFGLCYDVHVC